MEQNEFQHCSPFVLIDEWIFRRDIHVLNLFIVATLVMKLGCVSRPTKKGVAWVDWFDHFGFPSLGKCFESRVTLDVVMELVFPLDNDFVSLSS